MRAPFALCLSRPFLRRASILSKYKNHCSLAQHFRQFREARFKGKPAVNEPAEEGNERGVDERDEDGAGAEAVEAARQGKGQHGGKQQHDDVICKLHTVDVQPEAAGNLADQELVDGDGPRCPENKSSATGSHMARCRPTAGTRSRCTAPR